MATLEKKAHTKGIAKSINTTVVILGNKMVELLNPIILRPIKFITIEICWKLYYVKYIIIPNLISNFLL